MLKKWMTAVILMGLLSACGNNSSTEKKDDTAKTPATSATTTTPAPAEPADNSKDSAAKSTDDSQASADKKEIPADFKTYENEQFNVSYPKSWSTYDSKQLNNPMVKVAFYDPKPTGNFATNINVTMNADTTYSAKDIADSSTKMLEEKGEENGMANYKQIDYKDMDHSGFKAGISTSSYTSTQTKADIILSQLIIPAKKNTYVVSFSATKEDYEKSKDTVLKDIIDSFTIKE
ncbi:LpqN/LpqT family lipoprotein [Paenibacillus zeisoli]|uniref:LpqN/LpqT family lipoprotein n=1 Tax=Paenibacillus zeisoli TaxID=2496267 RepID=UPI00163CA076|nr:LpqN/LpqT family lipoprotein [Paenibacillus zeisoli]